MRRIDIASPKFEYVDYPRRPECAADSRRVHAVFERFGLPDRID